jgi:Flp pilus assembly protein TadB
VRARLGVALSGPLQLIERDLSSRLALGRTVAEVLAGPRASAFVLAGLPIVGLVLAAQMGAHPVSFLTSSAVGRLVLLAGAVLAATGLTWSVWLASRAERPLTPLNDPRRGGRSHRPRSGGGCATAAEARAGRRCGGLAATADYGWGNRGRSQLTFERRRGRHGAATVGGLFVVAATHACSRERGAPTRSGGADLPLALELISAALRSGAPLPTAAQTVATTPGLAVGPDLARAATMLRLGADPMEAWARIASVDGAALLGAVAARSARSGVRLADTISRQADLLRAEIQTKAIRRAHRVGAVALLPLGLCYLPAFVCLGIVPMVAGLAAQAGR